MRRSGAVPHRLFRHAPIDYPVADPARVQNTINPQRLNPGGIRYVSARARLGIGYRKSSRIIQIPAYWIAAAVITNRCHPAW